MLGVGNFYYELAIQITEGLVFLEQEVEWQFVWRLELEMVD